MIVGLELVCVIGWIAGAVSLIGCVLFVGFRKVTVAAVFATFATVVMLFSLLIYGGISLAEDDIEAKYIDYLKLQIKVAQYDDLDMLEQYKVFDDVMTYNLWYERNKPSLNNEWTFKGSVGYAKEFDYIVIGG